MDSSQTTHSSQELLRPLSDELNKNMPNKQLFDIQDNNEHDISYHDYDQKTLDNSSSNYEIESQRSSETLIGRRGGTETKEDFKANVQFLIGFLLTLSCAGFQLGHVIASTNQVSSTFQAKFPAFQESPTFYQSVLGSSGILGTTIGAISGGRIIKIGRRTTFLIATVIGFIGCFIMMFEDLGPIIVGRMIYGLGCGLLSIVGPRYIEETVPDKLLSLCSPLFISSSAFGAMISLLLGAGLPEENDISGLQETGYWRVVMGCPLLLQIASFLSMIFYVKYDSIRFLINIGKYNDARSMIQQVYDEHERPNRIIEHIEFSSQREVSVVSLKQALTDPYYSRSTYIAIFVIIFHELTGENAILLYSTEMFKRMNSHQDGYTLSPRTGTILVGAFYLLAHDPAIYLIKVLPRKTLLFTGHLVMGLCHLLIGIFAAGTNDTGVVIMMTLFMITYVITNGPIIWLYVSEIVVDSALGVCLFVLWSVILLLSLFTSPMMESFMGAQGVFWMFGLCSLGGAWFTQRYVKETSGLNDKEKKLLYSPSKLGLRRDILKRETFDQTSRVSNNTINL